MHTSLLKILLLIAALAMGGNAAAVCSSYASVPSSAGPLSGEMTSRIAINEYNYSGNYIELKLKDTSLLAETSNLNGWVLSVYRKSGGSSFTRDDFAVSSYLNSCSNTQYIQIPVTGSGGLGNDTIVILWSDSARTQEVDYFRVGQSAYPTYQATTCFAASEVPVTSTTTYHQATLTGSAARKDIARSPDGKGVWIATPYNGSDQGTPCNTNDSTLAISKVVTSGAETWVNGNVTFRVTATLNSRAENQTSVVVNDLLPSGLTYVSHTASVGTYNSGTGVWSIGNLAAGVSVTLDITAQANAPGSLVNSAAISSAFFSPGMVDAVSATVSSLIPGLAVTVSPNAVAVNGTTTFTVTVTNPSATLASPAFTVGNVLDSGLTLNSSSTTLGAFNSGTGVWSIASLPAGGTATLTLNVTVTASGTWADSARVTINGYLGPLVSATVSASASNFNAWINADKTISTQLVDSAITLNVGAFDSGGALANYTGTIAVALEYCTNVKRTGGGGISCDGAWTAVPDVASVDATFVNESQVSVTTPSIPNVYEIVRVKLTPSAGPVVYASNLFAVRPLSLTVTASDTNWTTAGTDRSLVGGTVTHKAGRPFTYTLATAKSNYPGTLFAEAGLTPVVSLSPPASNVAGSFDAGTLAATSGGMQSTTAIYTEAGTVTLTVEDRHFADIDAADSTTAQRYFSGTATIGRFVPDYLTTTVTQGCSTFTYSGQSFSVKVDAFAFGAVTTLQNYSSAAGFSQAVTLSNAGSATNLSGNTLLASAFTAGTATASGVTYTFASVQSVPATLTLRAVDADGVSSQGATEGTTSIRSGRLWVANAYGSELLPLPVPMQTQYWSGAGWTLNTADNCTKLTVPTAASGLSNGLAASTTASLTAPVSSGKVNFRLSAPGAGNVGLVDIDASIVRGGNTWLQLSAPSARACFGRCGPRSPLIYLRERF